MQNKVDKIADGVKIKDIQILADDGDVNLILNGDILKEEIEGALAKSKVINS